MSDLSKTLKSGLLTLNLSFWFILSKPDIIRTFTNKTVLLQRVFFCFEYETERMVMLIQAFLNEQGFFQLSVFVTLRLYWL